MAFWGVEVKPGRPYTHPPTSPRLRITRATIGLSPPSGPARLVLQLNVGDKAPIIVCSLFPGKKDTLSLDLELEETEEVVLSVLGCPAPVHLAGYYLAKRGGGGDETDSQGEDIVETSGSSYRASEDEYESDFIDDGPVQDNPLTSSSDEDELVKATIGRRRLKKKYLVSSDEEEEQNDSRKKKHKVKGSKKNVSDSEHLTPKSESKVHSKVESKTSEDIIESFFNGNGKLKEENGSTKVNKDKHLKSDSIVNGKDVEMKTDESKKHKKSKRKSGKCNKDGGAVICDLTTSESEKVDKKTKKRTKHRAAHDEYLLSEDKDNLEKMHDSKSHGRKKKKKRKCDGE